MLYYKIKEARIKHGLTQQHLSRLSGVSVSMICAIENNYRNPTVLVLHELAKAMHLQISELYEECSVPFY
ncbi:helix-turn-helix domain-containing protein [Pectinatus sottacetonis]|uniref:helix-turn-helix domain-containing protein n=1 Tax=Pectinatus sottacetonis TaxID=1002795 RepID=UPI0018C5A804|nr:helix-turn-helix transcriptional regulator [Pectinatus sottacetonis]